MFAWIFLTAVLSSTQASNLDSRVRNDVRAAIRMDSSAKTFAEWSTSGFTPQDVVARTRATGPGALRELCRALGDLGESDSLLLFEDAIRSAQGGSLGCRDRLIRRIDRRHAALLRKLLRRSAARRASAPGDGPAWPSLVVREIDASNGPVYFSGEAAGLGPREVALTFSDGPDPARTTAVAAALEAAGVKATFFFIGEKARDQAASVRKIAAAGHTVASHTLTHPVLTRLRVPDAEDEIVMGSDEVSRATGHYVPFFRFPFGTRSDVLQDFVSARGMATFFWTIDALDWRIRDPNLLLDRLVSEVESKGRGIIAFQDERQATLEALPHFLEELGRRGFKVVHFVPAAP